MGGDETTNRKSVITIAGAQSPTKADTTPYDLRHSCTAVVVVGGALVIVAVGLVDIGIVIIEAPSDLVRTCAPG